MILNNNQYEFALNIPDCWTDFDAKREKILEDLTWKFDRDSAVKIFRIIDWNWSDFEGKTAILITVEGTKCLTWITDEFTPIECSEKVFPFDENQIYPQQRAEMKICFKRW